jgi:hypothetical protein
LCLCCILRLLLCLLIIMSISDIVSLMLYTIA